MSKRQADPRPKVGVQPVLSPNTIHLWLCEKRFTNLLDHTLLQSRNMSNFFWLPFVPEEISRVGSVVLIVDPLGPFDLKVST